MVISILFVGWARRLCPRVYPSIAPFQTPRFSASIETHSFPVYVGSLRVGTNYVPTLPGWLAFYRSHFSRNFRFVFVAVPPLSS
jgi:hypothetical protein